MKKTFTLHLSPNLLEKLASIAEQNQRSMAGQLRWLIINANTSTGIGQEVSDSEDPFLGKETSRNEQF
jgi:hypothetical protein